MAKLTQDGRGRMAEKLMEVGNLTLIALVVSQFVPGSDHGVDFLVVAIVGVLLWAGFYSVAYTLLKGGGKS